MRASRPLWQAQRRRRVAGPATSDLAVRLQEVGAAQQHAGGADGHARGHVLGGALHGGNLRPAEQWQGQGCTVKISCAACHQQ